MVKRWPCLFVYVRGGQTRPVRRNSRRPDQDDYDVEARSNQVRTYNYTYNNIGSTVDGYVTRNGKPVYWALVGLYRETGNEFAGFATTDHTGHYVLYNVPDGTYRVEATAEDYDGIYKTPCFLINDDLTIPAIELKSPVKAMSWIPLLLLND